MDLQIKCPHCISMMQVNGTAAGKQVRCPNCQNLFVVPSRPPPIPKTPPRPEWLRQPAVPVFPRSTPPALPSAPPGVVPETNPLAFLNSHGGESTRPESAGPPAPTSARPRVRVSSGIVTIILLILGAMLSVGGIVAEMELLDALSNIRRVALSGGQVDFFSGISLQMSLSGAQQRMNMYGGLGFLCSIILAAAMMLWMHRSHLALSTFGVSGLQYTAAGAIYWWLVPFANLVMPYLIMREIWLASGKSTSASDPRAWQRASAGSLVACWWAAWLGATVIKVLAAAMALMPVANAGRPDIRDAATFATIRAVVITDMVGSFVYVLATMLTIFVIRGIVERQQKWLRRGR